MEIRNFSIIAHIDHGKSTLADRLLEITGTVSKGKMLPQYLDRLDLEREKGITIKMQPVRMFYKPANSKDEFMLNLIDTPGHTDFSYEVSRALAAVEGAVLLVDGSRGVQAQTVANLDLAKKLKLKIIPVINKVDLDIPNLGDLKAELANLTGLEPARVSLVSAKSGLGMGELLQRITSEIPGPGASLESPLKALVFDSTFDSHLGIIAYLRIFKGTAKLKDKLVLFSRKIDFEVKKIGYFSPDFKELEALNAGEIGWIATGIKEPGVLHVGETITSLEEFRKGRVTPLPGFKKPQPMVFASVFPKDSNQFELLKSSLEKLSLNDSSFSYQFQQSPVLGRGFLVGALGLLHLDIITQRLKRHFNIKTVITWPSVLYKAELKDGNTVEVQDAEKMPEEEKIKRVLEPWVKLELSFPLKYQGNVFAILSKYRFLYDSKNIKGNSLYLTGEAPLSEIVQGFYDELKSATEGFGSYGYQLAGFKEADISKLEIRLAGQSQYGLSLLVVKEKAYKVGRELAKRLKELLPKEQFPVAIQAVWRGRVIARETLPPLKKDVTGYLYGGDRTRKMKLWAKQKKGKKKLKKFGQVKLPADVFIKVLAKK